MIKTIKRFYSNLPSFDTFYQRVYDLLPHRRVNLDAPVGFLSKALKDIERTEKRIEQENRASVRGVGRSHKRKQKKVEQATKIRALAHRVEYEAARKHAAHTETAVAYQNRLDTAAHKARGAKQFIRTMIDAGN